MPADPDRGVAVLARVHRTQKAHRLLKEDRKVGSVGIGSGHRSVHAFLKRRGSGLGLGGAMASRVTGILGDPRGLMQGRRSRANHLARDPPVKFCHQDFPNNCAQIAVWKGEIRLAAAKRAQIVFTKILVSLITAS